VGEPVSEDIPALQIQEREEEQQQEHTPQREIVDEGIAGIPLANSPNSIHQEDLEPREPTPDIPALIVEWDRRESEKESSPVEIHLDPSAPGSPVLKQAPSFELPILENINKIPVLKLDDIDIDTKETETNPKAEETSEDEEMATLNPSDSQRRGRSKSPGRERSSSRVQQYEQPTERERSRVRAPDPPTSRGYDERERGYGYDDRNVVTAEPRGNYGYRDDSPPRKGKYRDDSPPRKPQYREESPPKSKSIFKIPGAFKSKADSDDDDDDDLAYGAMPGEKKKKRKEKEKEDREYYEREERKYSAAGGKYEVEMEKHKNSTSDARGRYDDDPAPGKGKGASFNIGVGQHTLSGGVAVVHDTGKPQYSQAPPSPSAYNYKPPPSPAWGVSGYGAPVGYQPPVAGYAPPSPSYAPQTVAYAAAGGTYQPPYSAPQGPPPGRTYAEPPQWEYAQPDPMAYAKQSDTQVGYPARPASPPGQYTGGHSRHGSSYASPHGSSSNVLTVGPGNRRDPSPGPSSLAPRMHSLSVSTGHHGSASLSLANAPGSPLLEAYHGTYQSISPMPSPLMMPSGHGEVNYIEALSPGDDSDSERRGSKTRRTARFHDPIEEAKTLAAALRGEKRGPDVAPLIEILPGLTHEQVMDLRVEYKRIVKTGSEKKGVNVAKHIKLRLKDEDSSLMKACYACALGKWESEAYWANFWYQGEKSRRELLIESLMGRTNAEIRAIKDGFSDKKYSDSLTKCMKTELKEDKFKKAVLLVLEERKMALDL